MERLSTMSTSTPLHRDVPEAGPKVLIVTFEFVPFSGGIANYTLSVAKGLAELGCEVRVLAPHYPNCEQGDRHRNFETVRMSVSHGAAELTRFVPGIRDLNRQLRGFRPDVALLTSDLAHGLGSLLCILHRIPYVTVVHGSEITKHFPARGVKRSVQALLLRRCYRRAHVVVCVSHFVRDLMLAAGFSAETLRVVHNGVDDAFLETPRSARHIAELRDRYELHEKKIVLTVARLVRRKGQREMIRALPAIRARFPETRYVIAGVGDEERHLRALAGQIGVQDAVVFTGEISDADRIHFLDLCDVYVLPSRGAGPRVEGLGIALLEAAARGKPLIGGRHGGIGEIIEDGKNGFLVDPTDPAQLATHVVRLFDEPETARRMGAAAHRTVLDRFRGVTMARATKRELETLLAHRV